MWLCVCCAVVGEGGAGWGGGRWWCGERCDEVLVLKEDESRVRMQKKRSLSASLLGVGVSTTGLHWQNQPGVGVCVLCKKMSEGGDESCASMSNLKNERKKKANTTSSKQKWTKNEQLSSSNDERKKLHRTQHVVQLVCIGSWGRHVYDGGSRGCVCVCVEF